MFNPRGNLPPRPRGPNAPGPIPRGPFQGPESGSGGLQRQPPHGMAQRFVGSDMRAGFPGPNVQVTQHRVDPRQARERINMERQQKEEGHATHWDNPFAPGNSSRSQPASGRIAEHTTSVQSRYTNESASSILASFGLSNDDLEELSRYPDDQLTPENMPLILRDIRMHKMTRRLPSLPSQSREKETFSKDDGRGSMVKSKVIDYGHESKYGYTESPLDVKVYNSDVSAEKSMKGFQAQETAPVTATPPSIPSTTLNAVEELIRQMGFQRSTPNTQLFPPMDIVNKVPGLCLSSAGPVVPPAVQPMMPPVVSTMPQPVMPPVAQQALPPPPVAQPMMPTMNQPPPPFAPEMLEAINRHGRIQCESRGGKLPNPPPRPTGSQKNFQKESENPIESPFGVVKASWLPVFSQADAQKMKRLPTPSMMNDYYAASPRIFPHMCSLCNVECRHLKDWIQHQNSTAHIESCRQLRQQYPDWNPEAHSSYKRREGVRKENHGVRRRSASPSPKRSRRSSSGHARRRTRSRSRSRSPGRLRAARPRSRSPRRLPSPRRRSRSPRRCQDSSLWSRRSCSRERGLGRSARSPDEALEAAVKCLGPSFVKQFNKQEQFNKQFSKQEQFNKQEQISKQKSFQVLGRETSGTKRTLPELGKAPGSVKKTPSNPVGPLKPSKMDLHSHSVSSSPELGKAPGSVKKTPSNPVGPLKPSKMDLHSHSISSKPVEAAETKESNQGGMVADEKSGKLPSGAPTKETSAGPPVPYNRLLTEKLLRCGTVLRISDLPDDGFSDYDIKKIVQPFGKVSDLLVLRSRNEAFLEMNYKEAAIAAVKYSNTVPVLVNGRRVKIGIAEKPRASPSQNKGNGKKATKNVKKPPLNTKKDQTNSAEKMAKPAAPVTSTSKTNIKKPGEPPKGAEGEPASAKKSGATRAAVEPKMPADAKKPEEAKKALESKKTTEPKKVVESNAKEMPRPAQETEKVPGTTQAVKSTEAGESAIKEAEETCVVVISNLPEAGLTLDDISNLTKPFGGLKDTLIVSSHKKAYLEISHKSAESLVKFYTCFPMWVEKNQLCFTVASEFKDIKNEEAIFVAMIKDANPKVNTEALHAQFVYLGNLPDGGYSELEILCVGLRFGRVDHYMVITNKNKAILQLDSAESAASMCRFLKRYPYSLGDSQLTFSRSPKIEPSTAEVTKKEVRKLEPTKESPDLKKIPEGSGVVHAAAVPSAKPIEAKEEPSSSLKAKVPEGKTDKMVCEVALKPVRTEASEGGCGVAVKLPADVPADLGSSGIKLDGALALPPKLEEEEEEIRDICHKAELLENVSTSAAGNGSNGLSACAGELSEELPSMAETESVGSDFTRRVEREEEVAAAAAAALCETVPLDSAEAPVEEASGGDRQSSSERTSCADSSDASGNLAAMPATKTDKEAEAPVSTAEACLEGQSSRAALGETMEAPKKKPESQTVEAEAAAEKQRGVLVSEDGPTKEKKPEDSANEESSEQSLQKEQSKQDTEEAAAQSEDSGKDSVLARASAPSLAAATSVSKTILKALMSVPDISKISPATQKKEEQKSALKVGTRSQAIAEQKPVPKEASPHKPTNSGPNMPGGSKPKLNTSSLGKVGSGKSSSPQDKNSQVETKGSSKQTRERDSRSSSMKRDSGINKVSTRKNTRSSKSCTKSKEEEELFPFNLDEFVTVDEVTDEVDSPSPSKTTLPRGKRKELAKKNPPCEPTLKRKKGKNPSVGVVEAELSFVTLDEIGEDEGGVAQAAELLHLGAIPDPQVLVTVDEVQEEEEEQISEVARDPQLLVTLDEITEQEESAAKDAFPLGDSEPDLKAGPLVTVDEIGEVEELPLSEPSHFKVEEMFQPGEEEEKQAVEDLGGFLSPQMPDDPSVLVTVDEIHEDIDDQPLVTLDEVAEDDDDFLADFNRLKEELNFVTVDEVGSEDDVEEQDNILTDTTMKESVAETVPERETRMHIFEPGEDVIPERETRMHIFEPGEDVISAEPEVMGIPDDAPLERRVSAGDQLSEGNKISDVQADSTEKQSSAAEINLVEATLLNAGKDEKEGDLEKNKMTEADLGCEQPLTEPVLSRAGWSDDKGTGQQQPSDLDFLVPKAGFFCQICSSFCVDEASMKTHCQSQRHQQNMQKFMIKNAQEEEKKEGEENAEEQSSRSPDLGLNVVGTAAGTPVTSAVGQRENAATPVQAVIDVDAALADLCSSSPTRILICGHSILFWARKKAVASKFGDQLGLGRVARVWWAARDGMLSGQLLPMLQQFLDNHPPPQVLVLHLGEYDLVQGTSISLRLQIRKDLYTIRCWIPGIRILWSNMLPRRVWQGARKPRLIDLARKKVNAYLGRVVRDMGGAIIAHPGITYDAAALFRSDGVELTDLGAEIFLSDLQRELIGFLVQWAGGVKR